MVSARGIIPAELKIIISNLKGWNTYRYFSCGKYNPSYYLLDRLFPFSKQIYSL